MWTNVYNARMSNQPNNQVVAKPRRGKAEQAEAAFAVLVGEASRRGFYGTVSLSLNVQDGFIQHIRVATDRLLK